MFKFYLYVQKDNQSQTDASVKGFNDYNKAVAEKLWFEKLGYICTIKER